MRKTGRHPSFNINGRIITEHYYAISEDHVMLMHLPARERYAAFMTLFPWLSGRIRDKEVAVLKMTVQYLYGTWQQRYPGTGVGFLPFRPDPLFPVDSHAYFGAFEFFYIGIGQTSETAKEKDVPYSRQSVHGKYFCRQLLHIGG